MQDITSREPEPLEPVEERDICDDYQDLIEAVTNLHVSYETPEGGIVINRVGWEQLQAVVLDQQGWDQ